MGVCHFGVWLSCWFEFDVIQHTPHPQSSLARGENAFSLLGIESLAKDHRLCGTCLTQCRLAFSIPERTFVKRVCVTLIGCLVSAGVCAAQQRDSARRQQTGRDVRVCVTGYDQNRPVPFAGLGDFIGWAEAIEQLPNGDLLVAHSAGYGHVSPASPRNLAGQRGGFPAPTGGRSMACRSTDGGKTWSRPFTLIDHRLDDRPDALFACRDGTLLCFINVNASWSGFASAPAGFENDLGGLNDKQMVLRSRDNGVTWSDPIWLDGPGTFYERAHGRPLQLSDGGILWATYCEDVGGPESGGKKHLYGAIHRSDDVGKTWRVIATVRRRNKDIDEPAISELKDGRLIMATRPDGGLLYSSDRGVSWVESNYTIKRHGPTFRAPQLLVLRDGTLVALATWHVEKVGKGLPHLCAWISRDDGQTWSRPGFALDVSAYGYPGGVLLQDESILISYCEAGKAPNRVYVMRINVNTARDGIDFMPLDAPLPAIAK